jgi:hypothetical protein
MKIAPVNNNTTFQAQFVKTLTMSKLLYGSNKNTLNGFREVIKNAAKIKDKTLYEFHEYSSIDPNNKNYITKFVLEKSDKNNVCTRVASITKTSPTKNCHAGVLEAFLPILGKIFPEDKETREERDKIAKSIWKDLTYNKTTFI